MSVSWLCFLQWPPSANKQSEDTCVALFFNWFAFCNGISVFAACFIVLQMRCQTDECTSQPSCVLPICIHFSKGELHQELIQQRCVSKQQSSVWLHKVLQLIRHLTRGPRGFLGCPSMLHGCDATLVGKS